MPFAASLRQGNADTLFDMAIPFADHPPLWAKLNRDADDRVVAWHSLLDHSADVAAVLEALLGVPIIAERLGRLAGRPFDSVLVARLAALGFLHDIGKANRGFRARWRAGVKGSGHIRELHWLLNDDTAGNLQDRLWNVLGLERWKSWFSADAWPLWDTVFAHHGRPWHRTMPGRAAPLWGLGADTDPIGDLAVMGAAMPRWFPDAFRPGPTLPEAANFHHAFAGLLMLADWLGSDQAFFPFANGQQQNRMAFARPRAREALAAVGLIVSPVRARLAKAPLDFVATFDVAAPRPVQAIAPCPEASCVVLEAETGSGKTEAALWRFLHLFRDGKVDGLYFALPTRVAATQVFHRVVQFCDRVFGAERPAVVLAVPGQQMADRIRGHPLPDFGFGWDDEPNAGARLRRWAAEHPKRFLAAQIAVGTIDQALLGAIQVRHAHLRGAALLRHLLVVDEVHASDRYMEALLVGLLRSHLRAGGHALLLSATLGAGMRAALLGTPVLDPAAAEAVIYPALSWANAGQERRLSCPPERDHGSRGRDVLVAARPWLDQPSQVVAFALEAARQGAKVLVIRNTVRAAIDTQRALEAASPDGAHLFRAGGLVTLHHGRFAPADRRLLDEAVQQTLGKNRPAGGLVVVGTQTLEVSLDLDADLLVTDLCPADVLLQRFGRLHRHPRPVRPDGFTRPRAVVLVPAQRDLLSFAIRGRHGLGGEVYDDLRGVEASWRLLEAHDIWSIPAMNRLLVERATHPELLVAIQAELVTRDPAWQACLNKAQGKWLGEGQQAAYALLNRDMPFNELTFDEDDRLATRLGAADRLLMFYPPPSGPFGQPVTTLRMPHRWSPEDAGPRDVAGTGGGFGFELNSRRFVYDRMGLRRGHEG